MQCSAKAFKSGTLTLSNESPPSYLLLPAPLKIFHAPLYAHAYLPRGKNAQKTLDSVLQRSSRSTVISPQTSIESTNKGESSSDDNPEDTPVAKRARSDPYPESTSSSNAGHH